MGPRRVKFGGLFAPLTFKLAMPSLIPFVLEHWRFCLLHFLEFAIWGAWVVVLGNMLNARGFTRKDIGRIYAAVPIGTMIASLLIGALVDRYLYTEWVLSVSHLIGGVLLLVLSRTYSPRTFFWIALAYAIAFAPTLGLVNSIVFAHDQDIFGGMAEEGFPWIRVFGTIGWIAAGLSHTVILKKDQPIGGEPLVLAAVLSFILGVYSMTLPATPPAAESELSLGASTAALLGDMVAMVAGNPVFFIVTLVAAMAMGLYFAFAALFLEKTGVPPNVVGPVMTLGQWIEIFFMLALPWFLGVDNVNMNWVLLAGITAWAIRFGFFSLGRPMPLVLFGIAIHGLCFDFFFAAGMINANLIAPENLKASSQSVYAFLVYGLGMYLGSEGSGWLNNYYTRTAEPDRQSLTGVDEPVATTPVATPASATPASSTQPSAGGTSPESVQEANPYAAGQTATSDPATATETSDQTDWRKFWAVPCGIVAVAAALFLIFVAR